MSRPFLIVFCGLLLMLNAFSCDIMLPAFWSVQQSFGAPIETVQSVIPVFLMAAGGGQLFAGPLSDRFGRRPIIVVGLGIYLLGLVVGLSAGTIATLLAGRALQGFGAAFGVVIGRAILRDTSSGMELARSMAMAGAIFAGGPILAPLLGFGLVTTGGWRAVLAGMIVFGGAVLAATLFGLVETNTRRNPRALEPASLLAAAGRVLAHPQSRYFLLLSSTLTFAIMSFVSNAPRLFRESFGIEGLEFALMFASTALGIAIGQFVNTWLIRRLGIVGSTRLAACAMAGVSVTILALGAAGLLGVGVFLPLMFLFNASFLVVMTNSAALVIDPHKEIAGLAS